MGGKTQIDGTLYSISGGKTQIGGTAYSIGGGKTQIGGTTYTIGFGTPMNSLPVGSSVYTNVGEVRTEFIIVQKGLPSSKYDGSCNGVWLLMKSCVSNSMAYGSQNYNESSVATYLNGTFFNSIEANVRNKIVQAKIPYLYVDGSNTTLRSGASGFPAKTFLLSAIEVGFTGSQVGNGNLEDGAKLDYFQSGTASEAKNLRLCYLLGSEVPYWTRTISNLTTNNIVCVDGYGWNAELSYTRTRYVRPCFIMPLTSMVDNNMNIV